MSLGQVTKPDQVHLEFATLALLQAFITNQGNSQKWGTNYTVFTDGNSSNNGDYKLKFGLDNEVKTNTSNLEKVLENSNEFEGVAIAETKIETFFNVIQK